MDDSALGRLSEAQKQCLRLVLQGYEAKEVARLIGTSPGAVTERLRAARRVLGVSSSRAAARMLAHSEQGGAYTPYVAKPIGVAAETGADKLDPSIISGSARTGDDALFLREEQASYRTGRLQAPRAFPCPVPLRGRGRNDLTILETGLMVLALTIGLGMAALMAVALVDQLSRLRAG